ncbi:MAG: hypothetical protein JW719_12490 [Pirellulales bacterium]|nr:hypothetical protein [Pirellulales bacterium]
MHTVDLLDAALALASQLGYGVREEWLGGRGGGDCEIRGRRWIFLDLALSAEEQLDQVLAILRDDPAAAVADMNHELRCLLGARKSA